MSDDGAGGHSIGRRELIAGVAGVIGAASAASAQTRARPSGLIDVHHHVLPPESPAAMQRHLAGWSAEKAVAQMDVAEVATGIAYPGPIRTGDAAERRAKARLWNDFAATLGQRHRGRFGLFASLPFPFVEPVLAEIDHALDDLKADGFGITTSYDDLWLGDARLQPIWDKLNARGAVVFVHPHDAACCGGGGMSYQTAAMDGSWIEWPMNTARTILSLMSSGTLRRFPRIRFIFSHGGGVMPLLIERLAAFNQWEEVGAEGLAKLFPTGIKTEFARLHFECAQACSATNMTALRSLVPDTQILFGSDYPFFPLPYAAGQLARLALPEAGEMAIARRNAVRLLPRWA